MLKLEHSPVLGRVIRLDDLDTLGVSTQTLAEEAIARGRVGARRAALVDYFYEEMRIMHGILTTWIKDILRYIVEHAGADDAGRARPRRPAWRGCSRRTRSARRRGDRCREAIAGRDAARPRSTGSTRCASSSRTRTRCWSRGSRTC